MRSGIVLGTNRWSEVGQLVWKRTYGSPLALPRRRADCRATMLIFVSSASHSPGPRSKSAHWWPLAALKPYVPCAES